MKSRRSDSLNLENFLIEKYSSKQEIQIMAIHNQLKKILYGLKQKLYTRGCD